MIGTVPVSGRAILAPMSGVTDLPFRRLVHALHGPLVVSEMVPCAADPGAVAEARLRAEGEGLAIHVVQLAGNEAADLRAGVRIAEAAGAHVIDINMGCPAKRVTRGYGGSALMRDLDHAARLIDAVVAAASVPVTVKMRLGWDEAGMNAADLARRAEAAGAAMVTVHGRTRCQFYNGRADWAAIREVVGSVRIPVVANGDLVSAADAPNMLRETGAAAVMIGRGACGRPWIVAQAAAVLAGKPPPASPQGDALVDLVIGHYEAMLAHYGRARGLATARKHLAWYIDASPEALPLGPAARRALLTADEPRLVIDTLVRLGAGERAWAA